MPKVPDPIVVPPITPLTSRGTLSAKACGIWYWMLSQAETVTFSHLVDNFTDGRRSIQTGLRELREHDYIVLNKVQSQDGQWSSFYTVSIPPRNTGGPKSVSGDVHPLKPGYPKPASIPVLQGDTSTGGNTGDPESPGTGVKTQVSPRRGKKRFAKSNPIRMEAVRWEMELRDNELLRKDLTLAQLQKWCLTLDRICRLDNHTLEDVVRVRKWLFVVGNRGRWWIDSGNFGSVLKLRRPSSGGETFFEKFYNQMTHEHQPTRNGRSAGPSLSDVQGDMHDALALLRGTDDQGQGSL